MEFAPLLALGALVGKLIDFLKYAKAKDWNATATIAIAWMAGIAATFLVAASSFAAGIEIGDRTLGSMTPVDLVFIGLMSSSIFGVVYDFKKATDTNRSTQAPRLIGAPEPDGER